MSTRKLIATAIVIVVLLFALAHSAKAQFRPCVWPNTCIQ